jgi:glyoxylase-like metal-dependent hydrolase (beta-lactamase superfamily II)
VNVLQIAPGLWRWTARHPDWTPEDGAGDGWEPEVASYFYESADGVVLIDPLVPADEAGRFWEALDRDIERSGRPPHALITIFWHARSAQAILDRYEGARVWAHEPARKLVAERTRVTDAFAPGNALPGDVEALDAGRAFEVVFWLPEHRAVVTGDVILGAQGGGVRIVPDSWLGDRDPRQVRDTLAALLELPVERVLVTHGEPVLSGGHQALREALGG